MTVERFVHAFAGTLVLTGIVLAQLVNPWFLLISAFVGANLLQSAFTRFCPLAIILRKLGMSDPVPPDARSL
jgi:hypothetical protein